MKELIAVHHENGEITKLPAYTQDGAALTGMILLIILLVVIIMAGKE